jgi:hypothetical protein
MTVSKIRCRIRRMITSYKLVYHPFVSWEGLGFEAGDLSCSAWFRIESPMQDQTRHEKFSIYYDHLIIGMISRWNEHSIQALKSVFVQKSSKYARSKNCARFLYSLKCTNRIHDLSIFTVRSRLSNQRFTNCWQDFINSLNVEFCALSWQDENDFIRLSRICSSNPLMHPETGGPHEQTLQSAMRRARSLFCSLFCTGKKGHWSYFSLMASGEDWHLLTR